MMLFSRCSDVEGLIQSRFFFFTDTGTSEFYTLSLHDALPISTSSISPPGTPASRGTTSVPRWGSSRSRSPPRRSEEHTSELQSRQYLVCRLLLEKKNSTIAGAP